MTLERRETIFQGETYRPYITSEISSLEDVKTLCGIDRGVTFDSYFYGAVLEADQTHHVYFASGPKHKILEQMVQEIVGVEGYVYTSQINYNSEGEIVTGVLFYRDPGEESDHTTPLEGDKDAVERRIRRIFALVEEIPPFVCDNNLMIGWLGRTEDLNRYIYLPQEKTLLEDPEGYGRSRFYRNVSELMIKKQ